ncbi:DUF3106 domain-containing protein [Pseudoxanthomonas sp. LH2527]|uniref:DUF3106 domain-containing protein n=1 Tax=Pseudoxanthomonas sp. LH2527 TaxID=2923249 RepID=UPI001F143F0E|nr:DUF3106 domain-containing protein [Pseudoxanthomonas sp. LH2527]MCH6482739.1 DUF3106 domain-containing protein [Pseudoxanthomonas sp. LH2527]
MRHADRRRARVAAAGLALLAVMATSFAQDATPAARWAAMSPTAQAAWQQRRLAWDALPRDEQADRRARYAAWRALDEVQRARLRAAASEIAALPPEHQAALRTQFRVLDGMQRQGWRLGPDLGADWPRLQPLFAYVPPGERDALLSLLRRMDAEQRDDLAALAQRLPPQDRDAFRRELLAVPEGQRRTWLRQRRDR